MKAQTVIFATFMLHLGIRCTEQTRFLQQPSETNHSTGPGSLGFKQSGFQNGQHAHISFSAESQTAYEPADIPNKCASLNRVAENLVVVAVHNEDISWLVTDVNVPFLAYHSGNATVRMHNNGAREASAYLQFIAEYYDCLPEVTAFIHAHRKSWHSHDMVDDLHRLKWQGVSNLGYMPLHQGYFRPWGMYFNAELQDPSDHLQTVVQQDDPEAGEEINGTYYRQAETYHYRQAQEIAYAWNNFFGPAGLGRMPPKLQYYCCAQFLVTTERIRRLPREFYQKAITWAVDGDIAGNFELFFTKGLVMETLWHVIFGEPAFLPKAPEEEKCNHFLCDEQPF